MRWIVSCGSGTVPDVSFDSPEKGFHGNRNEESAIQYDTMFNMIRGIS